MKQDEKDMTPFKANEIVTCIHCGWAGRIEWPTDTENTYHKAFHIEYVQRDWNPVTLKTEKITAFIELTCPACRAPYRRSPLSAAK